MILVTGATGFVGSAVVAKLAHEGIKTRACVRRNDAFMPDSVEVVHVSDMCADTDWGATLAGVGVVVHAAARVHVMDDTATDPLAEFRRINVNGTLNLARQAAAAGVRRFVFISSIKVNGEVTRLGQPFSADDRPAPIDPYGVSKMEAEQGLRELAAQTGMELVIVRPPLVYGPGVKANFAAMMRWLVRGVPLPLGAIDNRRSMVALDNLVDLLVTCMSHPAAANQTFLVCDGENLSTTELLKRTATAMGKKARLFPVPEQILRIGARLIGKPNVAQRLVDSLQVDISKTRDLLGWTPSVTVDQSLRKTAEHFLQNQQR
ncbi:MAG: SDR family oxidoreductase [Georgfuchsia sp.]